MNRIWIVGHAKNLAFIYLIYELLIKISYFKTKYSFYFDYLNKYVLENEIILW